MRRRPAIFTLTLLALGAQLACGAEPARTAPWIEIGTERAVLARHSKSADGRHALAWTVNDTAVDWALLESDADTFYTQYDAKEIWVVDLPQKKKLAVLGGSGSYLRPGSQRTLSVAWGPVENGRRFALAAYDWKWGTDTLLLLEIGPGGCTQAPIGKPVDDAVVAHLKQTARKQEGPFDIQYLLTGLPELGKKIGFSDAATVGLPFSSRNRKLDAPAASGVVVLKLAPGGPSPTATVARIVPGAVTDDSFTDATRLARADKELNAVYTALRRQLDPAAQEALRTEQRAWIERREQQADAAVREQSEADSPRIVRDRTLWKLTEERTAELRGQLKPGK
ncbi:MAG TPA: lysozyme inhibitor LprI family protein [Chthoniobacteraceae bacterium]|nr:lysozyme inhibitor LprI family protein [Chthoniobacteraceae bacterium]